MKRQKQTVEICCRISNMNDRMVYYVIRISYRSIKLKLENFKLSFETASDISDAVDYIDELEIDQTSEKIQEIQEHFGQLNIPNLVLSKEVLSDEDKTIFYTKDIDELNEIVMKWIYRGLLQIQGWKEKSLLKFEI